MKIYGIFDQKNAKSSIFGSFTAKIHTNQCKVSGFLQLKLKLQLRWPKMAKNDPKIAKNDRKWPKMTKKFQRQNLGKGHF